MIRAWLLHPIYTAFLALGWMVLNMRWNLGDFIVGYVIGAIIVRLHGTFWPGPIHVRRPLTLLRLGFVFLGDIIVANVSVAWTVVRPRLNIRPAFVIVPLDLDDDFRITLLANMISLTPGTLSVDLAPDRSALYVHCLSCRDQAKTVERIKNRFEKPIQEAIEC